MSLIGLISYKIMMVSCLFRIRAVPEGLNIPVSNILMSIECADPRCFLGRKLARNNACESVVSNNGCYTKFLFEETNL